MRPATSVLLAYFLGNLGDDVQALATMPANAADVGNQLALLIRWTSLNPQPIANALEAVARQRAHREAWEVLRALMTALLPWAAEQPQPRIGLGTFAKITVEAAGWTEARGAIPEVATVATGKSRSAFAWECRSLYEYLTRT